MLNSRTVFVHKLEYYNFIAKKALIKIISLQQLTICNVWESDKQVEQKLTFGKPLLEKHLFLSEILTFHLTIRQN